MMRWLVTTSAVQIILLVSALRIVSGGVPTLMEYQIGELERRMRAIQTEHGQLFLLLVANLCTVIASLVTYIITRQKR